MQWENILELEIMVFFWDFQKFYFQNFPTLYAKCTLMKESVNVRIKLIELIPKEKAVWKNRPDCLLSTVLYTIFNVSDNYSIYTETILCVISIHAMSIKST